jgi:tRNA1Val (adenine37-N6)-methyltransferase
VANTSFEFKQFTVNQQHCAMKVSTDACIFGAAAAEVFAEKVLQDRSSQADYLDIGAGTGLLSLMLAQTTTAFTDAVEIDTAAFKQAGENFISSPFKDRLAVYNTDILYFTTDKKYDGIICNPPFFEGDLQSPDTKKNTARHSTALTLQQLLTAAGSLLKADGLFAVLLPFSRMDECIKLAAATGLFPVQKLLLRHSLQHPLFRVVLFFSKNMIATATKELVIKDETGNYTDAFIFLLKAYYLYL